MTGPSRRLLLGGMGAALAACPFAARAHVTDAPSDHQRPDDAIPWRGAHQAGIATPRQAHGMIASFGVIAPTPDELEDLFRRLTARIAFLTTGGSVPDLDPRLPPADSGLLGPDIRPDQSTVTVSVGASLFVDRPWLAPLRPAKLVRMTGFPNDALDPTQCHGDLSLQICAGTQDKTIHALRDILKSLPDRLVLRWKQEGNVPTLPSAAPPKSARNFLGFRDGSNNPDANDAVRMDRLVWAGGGEPDWAEGGSYQVVRIIRNFVERWDRTPLAEQERIIGRAKMSGAPLDAPLAGEFATPDYAADPDGRRTPLDAHIRLANPDGHLAGDGLILRRPFNYSNGVTRSGHLDQGLLFIAYQADLDRGFIATQRRLDGEPLEEYIKPVGGGYFFSLPGATDYIGSTLVAAARQMATRPL